MTTTMAVAVCLPLNCSHWPKNGLALAALSTDLLKGIFLGFLGIFVSLIDVYDISDGGNGKLRPAPPGTDCWLDSGYSLLPVQIGVFGPAAIRDQAELGVPKGQCRDAAKIVKGSSFSLSVFMGQTVNLLRSLGIGTVVDILPGVGGSAAWIPAYPQTKTFSKKAANFGKGERRGLIASKSGNNGLTGGALVPLRSLGLPGGSTTALRIGAFTLQGNQVGML
ncbi:tripartite tricarboxylate transporter permease [Fluviibacterium sp. DFM31]|uniref:Tripartite tricarboxylate transporter permease n=1 Tax=Meridianimarinicoccus marinus TaxID=3231483 RepID=A0ABV3LA90_9RHOB